MAVATRAARTTGRREWTPVDLAFAGAARQAELVAAGEVSSRELVELYLERIERIDPQVNAFRDGHGRAGAGRGRPGRRRRAGGDERPLLGVPVAVKDNTDVAGEVTTHGTAAYGEPGAPRTPSSSAACARPAR